MAVAGAQLLHDLTASSVIGLVEVLRHYRYFQALFGATLDWIKRHRPGAVCFVDYPGFNLRLARTLHERGLSIKGGGAIRAGKGDCHGGGGGGCGGRRLCENGGVRRGGVDRPGKTRGAQVSVPRRVHRSDLEGVRSVREPYVGLGRRANRKASAIQFALEGGRS